MSGHIFNVLTSCVSDWPVIPRDSCARNPDSRHPSITMPSQICQRASERRRLCARSITLLETQGITTTEQYLSLGDSSAEFRNALATLLTWPTNQAVNIAKLTNGVVPQAGRGPAYSGARAVVPSSERPVGKFLLTSIKNTLKPFIAPLGSRI